MCLLFLSYKKTPGFKLVLAANRDEFLARPTASLDFLNGDRSILGGKDLQDGGTWLAIDVELRFAALTNYRDPLSEISGAASRGEIITNYLTGSMSGREYLQSIVPESTKYNGFNVLIGDSNELYYFSNRGQGPILLKPGFYGLSNHFLDTDWPKVSRGKRLLYPHMVETSKVFPEKIFEILSDRERPEDNKLPDTGIGLEWERLLSSIFIDSANYGTRSSGLLMVDDKKRIDFFEKTYFRQQERMDCHISHFNFEGTGSS